MITTCQVTTVLDKTGRQYQLTHSGEDLLIFCLHRSGTEVGTAKCIIDSSDMLLGDLLIYDGSNLSLGQRLMRRFNGEPVTYQGVGLGTALLKAILQYARDNKIRTIHGAVTQSDLDKNPYLLTWYQQYGFQIEEPTEQEVKSAIARIVLTMA